MSRGLDKKPRKKWVAGQKRTCKHCVLEYQPKVSVQQYCADCAPSPAFWRRIVLFGVGKREFDAMMTSQQGKCAICEDVINDSAHVDHDHVTLQVRGLLCRACNLRLNVLENENFVVRAQAYLKKCSLRVISGTMEDT